MLGFCVQGAVTDYHQGTDAVLTAEEFAGLNAKNQAEAWFLWLSATQSPESGKEPAGREKEVVGGHLNQPADAINNAFSVPTFEFS